MNCGYATLTHGYRGRQALRLVFHQDDARIPDPLINMSNIKVGGGAVGLVFSVGIVCIFLFGIPSLRWFPVGAGVAGLLIAIALRVVHEQRPIRLFGTSSLSSLPPGPMRFPSARV